MSKEEQQQHITSIGGQAVMEGVMMRGPFKTAVAVRESLTVILNVRLRKTEQKQERSFGDCL